MFAVFDKEKFHKNREKRLKELYKSVKIGEKRENREEKATIWKVFFFTSALLTARVGYATECLVWK